MDKVDGVFSIFWSFLVAGHQLSSLYGNSRINVLLPFVVLQIKVSHTGFDQHEGKSMTEYNAVLIFKVSVQHIYESSEVHFLIVVLCH